VWGCPVALSDHPELRPQPYPPAPKGNARALKHGATSERRLAPLRDEFAGELRRRFPHADELRIGLAADRLARWRCAVTWLDGQPNGVVRNRRGEVFDVADRVEKWSNRAEQVLAELEQETHGATVSVAQALSESHPVLRAGLLRAAGIAIDELPEEAERA
jgi:hypothetical protein